MFRPLLISLCLICPAVSADTPVVYEDFKLIPSDGIAYDRFGISSSLDGNIAIIGTYPSYQSSELGSAYIYRFDGNTWIEEAKLTPSDGAYDDRFGFSVSISGDTAAIGAYKNNTNGI